MCPVKISHIPVLKKYLEIAFNALIHFFPSAVGLDTIDNYRSKTIFDQNERSHLKILVGLQL